MAIHFDLVYMPASVEVEGHPGARSMGTTLIGAVQLENREKVFVTALPRPIQESLRIHIEKLRSARLRYADGRAYEKKIGLLAFGTEPNADANDGTEVGILLDITPRINDAVGAAGLVAT